EVELVLDSGETKLLKRGNIGIQRGTIHAWRNTSEISWASDLFGPARILAPTGSKMVG
ncbi:hypothetical protein AOQ84DRAFT_295073, partial [Glonium stellatum]